MLPLEVGRRFVQKIGLAGSPIHRPSLLSQYSAQVAQLSPQEKERLNVMIDSRTVPEGASPATLSAALAWSEFETPNRTFRRAADTIDNGDQVWRRELWAARLASGNGNDTPSSVQQTDPSLIQAHLPSRITMGGGYRNGSGAVLNASARWLLHDAVDPQAAYPPISSVEVARIDLGVSMSGKPFLDEATALRVERLAPASDLQSVLAWKIEFGVRRLAQSAETPLHLGAEMGVGIGTALVRADYLAAVYSMVGMRPGFGLASGGVAFLPAGIWSGGLILRLPADLRARVSGEY